MNGWFYDAVNSVAERNLLAPIRAKLLPQLEGEILEIGAGTGASFPYYGPSARVRAIEPDPSMLSRAKSRAKSARVPIEIIQADDAILDGQPADTIDSVVGTLVLCSVEDPVRTLKRIHRILKPGASFVMIEHVRADDGWARLQDWLTPLWRHIAENCHLNRVLEPSLTAAGFSEMRLESRKIPVPVRRLVYGVAIKGFSRS